ncbi:hypothetical protein Scep_023642 [Stephania cephalantha]|uniref:Integrase catalytic domain-containing protein n=1 Tax=Stephania cephalantha TaxID=152367 RepID=A0AAP0HWG0_9MAGN
MMVSSAQENAQSNMWYLDSACSNHMCGNKEFFDELDESMLTEVKFADDRKLPVKGKGRILIQLENGDHQYISDVLYVPTLTCNLLSLGQLLEKGYKVDFKDSHLTVFDSKGMKILKSPLKNRLFQIEIKIESYPCFKSIVSDESWLWHLRYGHLNFESLKLLTHKNLVKGLPVIQHPEQFCEGCISGEQHRRTFASNTPRRAKSLLQLVHSDVYGPLQTASLGGSKYFMTFIDDCSRMIWVYTLKNKSDAVSCFQKFKATVEKQSGRYIKTLRTDGGGEYTSSTFSKFCDRHGIKHEIMPPQTLQQNGVAERKNKTIIDMAHSMLKAKGLPDSFWAEAVACSVYLLNRSPTKGVSHITPEEAWSGYKPSVKHLKVFGSIAYVHVLDANGEEVR